MSQFPVAETILSQIGGRAALKLMIGANIFFPEANSLMFKFAARSKVGNCVKIVLNPKDLYDVFFYSVRVSMKTGVTMIEKAKLEDIDCEYLRRSIENTTGLRLAVPVIIFK